MATRDTIIYFPLEPYASRYTSLTSTKGGAYAHAFANSPNVREVHHLAPWTKETEIKHGNVVDYRARTEWCSRQLEMFYKILDTVDHERSVIFLEDFWTPGMEMIPYAMAAENKRMPIYSFCHAQTPDIYDFTYGWRLWMRPFEQAWAACHTRIFCASSTMVDDWRSAQMPYRDKLMPVGHAYNHELWTNYLDPEIARQKNRVVFASRIAPEKNPEFFAKLARNMPEAEFLFLCPHKGLRGESAAYGKDLYQWLAAVPNLALMFGLGKKEYMRELQRATVLFNCSHQDYVSYVLLDAVAMGAEVLFPNIRSFPNALHNSPRHLYAVKDNEFNSATMGAAMEKLRHILSTPAQPPAFVLAKYRYSVDRMIRVMTEVDESLARPGTFDPTFDIPLAVVEKKSYNHVMREAETRL